MERPLRVGIAGILLALVFQEAAPPAAPAPTAAPTPASPVVPRDWLVLPPVDLRGRRPFNPSATFAKYLLDPASAPPKEGDKLTGELGVEKTWTRRQADENGSVGGEPAQIAFTIVEWPEEGVALADLDGAGTAWVNGVPQIGDPYQDGMGGLPVAMKKGPNSVYVTGMRGGFRLAFAAPGAPFLVNPFDATRGDVVRVRPDAPRGLDFRSVESAILVVNATDADAGALEVVSGARDDGAPFLEHRPQPIDEPGTFGTDVRKVRERLGPRGIVKLHVPARMRWDATGGGAKGPLALPIRVDSKLAGGATSLPIEMREPGKLRRDSYVSAVDGSVQEFALLPASGAATGIVLTLHGAGVDCWGQAASYSQKPDLAIAAPTNRRRFGFDWQDWGRRDAYDVLAQAKNSVFPGRVERLFLTGHSMGGHGTWHLAANDPDTFAAIAPSAGWSSFDSYGGGRPKGALAELWQAADGGSRTLALVDNLKQLPTFILHGSGDDNVPLREAQLMLDALTKAGAAPFHHFQEGAGHWWDGDAAPGADCVDWPAIFELFAKSPARGTLDPISFTTADPSYSSRVRWIVIEQPLEYGRPAHVDASYDPRSKRVTVTTDNVGAIVVYEPEATVDPVGRFRVTIDGESPRPIDRADATEPPSDAELAGNTNAVCLLVRREGRWRATNAYELPRGEKRAKVSGPFKRLFDQAFVLVYGSAGSAAETKELYERARYDAALWWYRANGHAPVLSDVEFLEEFAGTLTPRPDGNTIDRTNHVILYGNRDTNRAWAPLLPAGGPIDVRRGAVTIGSETFRGDDLGALFVRPHPTRTGLVGVFADSGVTGTRLGYTLTHFISGVGYPDYALFSSRILTEGDGGVLAAGWFAHDWSLPAAK